MGFWHTGYAEFHEEVGLGDYEADVIVTPQYPCNQCDAIFDSLDLLRTHRFEKHPIESPVLLVRGVEIGGQPVQITTPLAPTDVALLSTDEAIINGKPVSAAEVGEALSRFKQETAQIQFGDDPARFPRVLHFRVASHHDLIGVEHCFRDTAADGRLDRRAIDDFIDRCKCFPTAGFYCDGIAEYLYGVLAKERSNEVDIPYERHREKFNRAAESLADVHRPLAQQILGLIDFNFNLMASAATRGIASRVGIASERLRALGRGHLEGTTRRASPRTALDRALTDADTEAIVGWACQALPKLVEHIGEIEKFSRKPLAELDKSKCHIILAAIHHSRGAMDHAIVHARELFHLDQPQLSASGLVERIEDAQHQ